MCKTLRMMRQRWRRKLPRTNEELAALAASGEGRFMTERIAVIPEWDKADRMRKALRGSGMTVQEMADYLGVARNTVSTWINGRIEPSPTTLRVWAMTCGVSYRWLCHGTEGPHPRMVTEQSPTKSNSMQCLTVSTAA